MITNEERNVYINKYGLCISIKLVDDYVWVVSAYNISFPNEYETLGTFKSKKKADELFNRQAVNMMKSENEKIQ